MRSRILLGILSCLLLASVLLYAGVQQEKYACPMPEPSHPGGYYDGEFTLLLSAPDNGTIYYTTDGSTPDSGSAVYQGGIDLRDRSSDPNVLRSLRNINPDWLSYTPDPTPVPKGTVVRAVYINREGLSSEVLTQTYFIGMTPPAKGYTLSLAAEPEALFGSDGLYITGEEFDEWYLSGGEGEAPTPNYRKKLETEAVAELMDSTGDYLCQNIGLKLQGSSSRLLPLKRFTLTAREEYGGKNTFDLPLYEGISSHSVMLKSALPDAIAFDLVGDRAVSAQKSIPVRVYLNGEYMYQTYMLERYDKQYFRQYFDVGDRILVKDGVTDWDSAIRMTLDEYGEFLYWVENTDFSDPEQWQKLENAMDVQSYIDYISINCYLCNNDFFERKNYVLWRSFQEGRKEFEDLRWRWCLYDMDALENAAFDPTMAEAAKINIFNTTAENIPMAVNETILFRSLRRSPEFCRRFVLSYMDLVNNNFAPQRVEAILAQYGKSLDWMNGFFRDRPLYAPEHLAQEFGLSGSLETVTVTTSDPGIGSVQVGTSVIDLSGGSWIGQYFTDYPITLTATPAEGYQFVGWKGGISEDSATVTVDMSTRPVLEAVFAKAE